jgi:hypothetical protein
MHDNLRSYSVPVQNVEVFLTDRQASSDEDRLVGLRCSPFPLRAHDAILLLVEDGLKEDCCVYLLESDVLRQLSNCA